MPSMCKNIWIPDLMLTTNKDGKICMRRLFEGGVIFVGSRCDMHKRINWSSVSGRPRAPIIVNATAHRGRAVNLRVAVL